MAIYDTIGTTYADTRRPDPRIAHQIDRHLADVATVINVGAGSGSYEPLGTVIAVDPSAVMIAQRPTGSALAVQACAEALPIPDGAADVAMALMTVHHWTDAEAGIAELRRVARRRVLLFTWDQSVFRERFWLVRDYLPEAADFDDRRAIPIERLIELLPGARVETVPVPHDCTDGFGAAYWRRPEMYLDPAVRAGISLLVQTDPAVVRTGIERLADDLSSGRWHDRYADLMHLDALDVGYRLIVADALLS